MPAPTTPPTIDDLPPAAVRGSASDGDAFVAIADMFNAAQQPFGVQIGAVASWMYGTAGDVFADASTATAAAASAVAAAGAAKWVSGTSYVEGDVRWSPIDYKSYRRKTNGAGTTDPSLDGTNWAALGGLGDVLLTAVQTLTNKTLTTPTISSPTIDGAITEDVYTIPDSGAVVIDPRNGSIQKWTLGANRTPTAANFQVGDSVTIKIADGAAYAVTWTSILSASDWLWGIVPSLPTTGYGVVEIWRDQDGYHGSFAGTMA